MVTTPRGVVTLGEPLIAFIATNGPLAIAEGFTSTVTGAEVNVAVALARLGHRVTLIARLGDDGLGTRILRFLRAEGIDISQVSSQLTGQTGLLVRDAMVAGPSDVEYRRANSAGTGLNPDDVRRAADVLAGSSWLHVTGITPALSELCAAAVSTAVHIAHEAKVRVSLDVNMRRTLWAESDARRELRALLPCCDVVMADRDELLVLTGHPDPADAVSSLLDDGIGTVIEKRGANGAVLHRSGVAPRRHRARTVTVRDHIGAGDAFAAGYISAQLELMNDADSLERACTLGTFAVTALGDTAAMPERWRLLHTVGDSRR